MRRPTRPNPSPPDPPFPWFGWLLYAVFVLIVGAFCLSAALSIGEPAEPSGMTKGLSCEIAGYDLPTYAC